MICYKNRLLLVFFAAMFLIGESFDYTVHTYVPVCKIPLEGGMFTTDNLQNVYVYERSTIKKYNPDGKLQYTYSDKTYGDITSIDVYDPMKIMVFYKGFPQLIFLDNTLSQNGAPVDPSVLGYPLASLACVSHDNGVWFYDPQVSQLVRFDINLNPTEKTGNLNQALGIVINPVSLIENNSYLYLSDTAQGILVFDGFGTYYKTIPLKKLTDYEVRGDDMFYLQGKKLHTFHLKTITEDSGTLPDSLATQARVEKNMLFEKYNDTVRVYQVK